MKIQNIWRVLSLVVALFAALSLTFTPALAPNFNLAPVFAEDDDDDDDKPGRDDDDDDDDDDGEVIEFAQTAIFFEFNSSDNDLGIHIFFDAVGWEEVEVSGSGTIFEVENGGSLKKIGSTEVFTESAEPPLCAAEKCEEGELEAAIDAFQAMFPEGEYTFEGETVNGDKLVGTAVLSHALPAAVELDVSGFPTIEWKDTSEMGDPEIVGYQAVFEFEEGSVFVFSVDLPATATAVTVPEEFLEALEDLDGESKAEVLAIAANGNKTITEEEVDFPEE